METSVQDKLGCVFLEAEKSSEEAAALKEHKCKAQPSAAFGLCKSPPPQSRHQPWSHANHSEQLEGRCRFQRCDRALERKELTRILAPAITTICRSFPGREAGSRGAQQQSAQTYMALLPAVMLPASNEGWSFLGILLSACRKRWTNLVWSW